MASSYSAQEVITGALKWAKMIAETDKYTYKRLMNLFLIMDKYYQRAIIPEQ